MDKLGMLVCLKVMMVKQDLEDLMKEERGAVDIVAIVVMIGIAVALAVVFRSSISELLKNLFKTISKSASGAVGPI